MKKIPLWLVFGCVVVESFGARVVPLNERIAVSSTAASDYVRRELGGRKPEPESYVFTPGNTVLGGSRDGRLAKTTFEQLTRQLAPDLAVQNYFPTSDLASANLLIVVHWGVSEVFSDPQREASIEGLMPAVNELSAAVREQGFGDTGAVNGISDSLSWASDNIRAAQMRNAVLLGYARNLRKYNGRTGFVSDREERLYRELSEERYFVVLMAYDYQLMRKEKRSKLLWTTRLSVRSAGNNFTEALPVLSQAGGSVFGRDLEELVHIPANVRQGRVDLGELKVIGVSENTAPDQGKK